MNAKEAAEWVKQHEDCTDTDIVAMVPTYKNDLPRRAWIKTFKDHLPAPLAKRFSDLK
jgi:hypothetical protein